MPQVKSKEEVKAMLDSKKGSAKPTIFGAEIDKLKKGDGLFIPEKEWTMKTTPSAYYYGKYRKGKDVKTVSVSKVEGGYLVSKV